MKPLQILSALFGIAMVVGFPHLGLAPLFLYTIPVLLVVWMVLRHHGDNFADVGFLPRTLTLRAAVVGAISAVSFLAFMQLAFFPILERFVTLAPGDTSIYEFLRESPANLIFMIVMAWIVGGFYEEIVFHGFIFTRLEKMLPGRQATGVAFIISCFLFGIYHLQLGYAGTINALIVGAVYQGLFLAFKRNLWASIICHGVYNTCVMVLVHLGHL